MIRGKSFFTIFFSLLDDHHPISWQMPKTPAISQRANWKAHVIEKTPEKRGGDTNTIRAWFYFHFKNRTLLPQSILFPLFLLSLIQLKRGFDEPKPTLKFMISKRDFPMPHHVVTIFKYIWTPSTYPWKRNATTELIPSFSSWHMAAELFKILQKCLIMSLTNMTKNETWYFRSVAHHSSQIRSIED